MQPNKTKDVEYTHPYKYNQTNLQKQCKICNFFTFICHSCLYWHCTYLLKQYINIIRFNYQKSLMQILVCLFMGGHKISIKSIFDFRTSLPINEILYIQYINGKRKKSHRIKSHKKKKSQEKMSLYIFSTFTIPRKVTVCIMSDFVHTQVMVFIATFKIFTVIWWLSVLSLQYISNLVSFW